MDSMAERRTSKNTEHTASHSYSQSHNFKHIFQYHSTNITGFSFQTRESHRILDGAIGGTCLKASW